MENMEAPTKILLIDDDSAYRLLVEKVATRYENLNLKSCGSLVELGSVCCLGQYDVIIVDYDLGMISGEDIAHYTKNLFGDSIPLVLISSSPRLELISGTVLEGVSFILKSGDYEKVLNKAMSLASSQPLAAA
jgi:DNA-binding NtrC family response regulator